MRKLVCHRKQSWVFLCCLIGLVLFAGVGVFDGADRPTLVKAQAADPSPLPDDAPLPPLPDPPMPEPPTVPPDGQPVVPPTPEPPTPEPPTPEPPTPEPPTPTRAPNIQPAEVVRQIPTGEPSPVSVPTSTPTEPAPGIVLPDDFARNEGVRISTCPDFQPMPNPPRFLSLPFPADPQMVMFQGWHYTGIDRPHCGVDFGKWDPEQGSQEFPVLAAADGYACAETGATDWGGCVAGYGGRVLIRHEVGGRILYTYYGHLRLIDPAIPVGNRNVTIAVRRGQLLGYASNTGTGGGANHLHFGVANPWFGWFDPYDIWRTREFYPDPLLQNGLLAGTNHFWISNPPRPFSSNEIDAGSYPAIFAPIGTPTPIPFVGAASASLAAERMVAGIVDLGQWVELPQRDSGEIEVWINGRPRGRTPYGPVPEGTGSSFRWLWDTTQERNGPHTVLIRKIGEDGSFDLLLKGRDAAEGGQLVSVQNPRGLVDTPAPRTVLSGQRIPITGWANVEGSQISAVEIWIDGVRRGEATYGIPDERAGGDFGFRWEWDTSQEADGRHTLIVKVFAENGGFGELPGTGSNDPTRTVHTLTIRNRGLQSAWFPR